MTWNKLLCDSRELQLIGTLNGGQSFRWNFNENTGEWLGVFARTVWKLRQENDCLQYQVIGSLQKNNEITNKTKKVSKAKGINYENMLKAYFRLDVVLNDFYREWSEKDELFKSACEQFYGIRMLQQEPVENLFSFICSQNNHISRISGLVEKLCTHYGAKICDYEGVSHYAFPEVELLAGAKVEKELRDLGFGYRSKFIQKSAEQIVEWGKEDWFKGLEIMKYEDARKELMKLHGIGPKVADCICLMSLNHLGALPVDTHVYQIATQNYLPHLKGKKSITPDVYMKIGDHFRNLFGPMAGWAHTVLFCADLKKFKTSEITEKTAKAKKRKCT